MLNMWRELPPTSGLPLRWSDFFVAAKPTLEEQLSRIIEAPVEQVECSGTASLVIALNALRRVSTRRKVVIPGYTCPLVPIAIHQAGLQPILCDTARDSFALSITALASCLDEDVLAVIPTHIGGIPTDLEPVLKLARQAGAYVIEDAAQALGARMNGRPVGTLGDIGFFSLTVGKGLSIFQGGFSTSSNPEICSGLRSVSAELAHRMWWRESMQVLQMLGCTAVYNPIGLYFVYGMPLRRMLQRGDISRATGDVFTSYEQVFSVSEFRKNAGARAAERFDSFLSDNRRRARQRIAWLREIAGINVLEERDGASGSFPFLTVTFDDEAACRTALSVLWPAGLGVTQLFAHALRDYEYLRNIIPEGAPTPNASRLAARTLTITNSQWLSDAEFHTIRVSIAQAVKRTRSLRSHALKH